jgi:hypothetical protein
LQTENDLAEDLKAANCFNGENPFDDEGLERQQLAWSGDELSDEEMDDDK